MIIDAHTHIYKEGDKTFTAKDLLLSMDNAKIDYSLLLADGAVEGGTSTAEVIKICEKNARLKAIGCLQYKTLDDNQIQKLLEYLRERKIYGVKLYPPYEEYYPQDKKLFPFYEQCQKLGKPIIIHTGMLMPGLPGLLKQSHPLNLDEIANAFPNLKIIMAHFGNPWITDAMMVMVKNKNIYADLSGYFETDSHI
jgi:predicted TIM-barrel fold metal-dependent hydrolase